MNDTTVTGTGIELRRRYAAPPERVFRAFTTADDLKRWYAPVAGWTVSRAECDARPGGGYHLEFGPPGQSPIVEDATFLEFEPPHRLVIQVRLAGSAVAEATIATVTFTADGDSTIVIVRETGYTSEEIAQRHAGGWTTMLTSLGAILEG